MSNLNIHETPILGLKLIERQPNVDRRGYLERLFCQRTLSTLIKGKSIRQVNQTLTKNEGTVRGLHFQYPPQAEAKIVSCLRGHVWDVAVDLRAGSSTYLNYHAVVLSEENRLSYLIPEGFAHGFQTLTPNCEMLYFHTEDYDKFTEGALNALEPKLGIQWPKLISERSEKDLNIPMLKNDFTGVELC